MNRSTNRATRVVAALTVGLAVLFVPTSTAGAGVGGADSGTVRVNVHERTDHVDIDDVTVVVRWVGAGVDLGPAPAGDAVFDALPAGYSVSATPTVDRVETGVTAEEEFSQELDTHGWVYGEDYTGDPNDPFSWVAYGNEDIDIDLTLVQTITRTHHITETRTYAVVRDTDGPGASTPPPTVTVPQPTGPEVTVPEPSVPGSSVPDTSVPSSTGPSVGAGAQGTSPQNGSTAAAATAVSANPTYAG